MRTVRNSVFETNSSSAHCLVTAPNDQFAKFVNGQLFAREGGYKYRFDTDLITMEEVYRIYLRRIAEENLFYSKHGYTDHDVTPVPMAYIKWWMLHPETISKYEGNLSGDWKDDAPEDLRNFFAEHDEPANAMNTWITDSNTPFSFAMLDYNTEHFTTEYDDYESEPPFELEGPESGKTRVEAVWYY